MYAQQYDVNKVKWKSFFCMKDGKEEQLSLRESSKKKKKSVENLYYTFMNEYNQTNKLKTTKEGRKKQQQWIWKERKIVIPWEPLSHHLLLLMSHTVKLALKNVNRRKFPKHVIKLFVLDSFFVCTSPLFWFSLPFGGRLGSFKDDVIYLWREGVWS